jgi:hypothetical protein
VSATNERREVALRVDEPRQHGNGTWSCVLSLRGLYDNLAAINGEDSLQALCLALRLAERLLREFVAAGGRLELETGDPFPIDAIFGRPRESE